MRILIVEDNHTDQELLLEMLQDQFIRDAKFRVASNLEMACQYLNRTQDSGEPFFDVMLLDLGLPDSTGLDTFNTLHSQYPGTPIVVISHNNNVDMALELIRKGAKDYILKDYTNPVEVYRRILFAIERTSLMPPQ